MRGSVDVDPKQLEKEVVAAQGRLELAKGTPEEIARNPKSYTGHYLKKIL